MIPNKHTKWKIVKMHGKDFLGRSVKTDCTV